MCQAVILGIGKKMGRRTKKRNAKEFTRSIHSTVRSGTKFSGMKNWNEKEAKAKNKVSCKDCRYYSNGCDEFIGKWHSTCDEFQWW